MPIDGGPSQKQNKAALSFAASLGERITHEDENNKSHSTVKSGEMKDTYSNVTDKEVTIVNVANNTQDETDVDKTTNAKNTKDYIKYYSKYSYSKGAETKEEIIVNNTNTPDIVTEAELYLLQLIEAKLNDEAAK